MKKLGMYLVLGAVALLPLPAFAQGTIVYVNPPDVIIGSDSNPKSFDLDGDGMADLVFGKIGGQLSAIPARNNQVSATPGEGSLATPIPRGATISASTSWQGRRIDPLLGDFGSLLTLDYTFPATGPFAGVDGYLGIRFYSGSNLHYGWIRLDFDNGFPNVPQGFLTEWAYSSVPGQPITAGAVPEPSTVALIALGAVGLWKFRRRVP